MAQKFHEGEALKNLLKGSGKLIDDIADILDMTRQNLNYHFRKEKLGDDFKRLITDKLKIDFPLDKGNSLRNKKAFGDSEDDGLIIVPIAAQAGYAKQFDQPVYINQLDRVKIPGNPFKGDKFRFFEVEGDSMYPTLQENMQVIAQKVEQEDWKHTHNYYIHVIITSNQILIKRLVRIKGGFAAISDNEQLYPQVFIDEKDVKELWVVKRMLDWRMAPPKQYEVTVKGKAS